MRIFLSAGEPSGDLHGSNLARALQQRRPDIECVGFGGERMEAAGCRLLYPLCRLPSSGSSRVFANVAAFVRLLRQADAYFEASAARRRRPHRLSRLSLVAGPAGQGPRHSGLLLRAAAALGLGRLARREDAPLRRSRPVHPALREALVSSPRRRPPTTSAIPTSTSCRSSSSTPPSSRREQERPGTVVGLLPGSRNRSWSRTCRPCSAPPDRIHAARPDTRFLVACFKEEHRQQVEDDFAGSACPSRPTSGRTAEIIHLAKATVAVSGSVGLELLYRGKPSVVVYRVPPGAAAGVAVLAHVPVTSAW